MLAEPRHYGKADPDPLGAPGDHGGQVDRLTGLAGMLADPGQPEHVVDQPAHAPRLQHDPVHHLVDLVGAAQRALLVKLGIGAQRGQRRTQLVAGVGEELAHLLLAGLAHLHVGLDPGQRAVQGRAEPAHLAAGIVRDHPVGEVAGRDPVGLGGHGLDRAQPAAQHDEDAEADEQHHSDRTPVLEDTTVNVQDNGPANNVAPPDTNPPIGFPADADAIANHINGVVAAGVWWPVTLPEGTSFTGSLALSAAASQTINLLAASPGAEQAWT